LDVKLIISSAESGLREIARNWIDYFKYWQGYMAESMIPGGRSLTTFRAAFPPDGVAPLKGMAHMA
jgi:hypothetical protein